VLFSDGLYEPLSTSGSKSDQICAFARTSGDDALIVIAARFPARAMMDPGWEGSAVAPSRTTNHARRWRDLLTGHVVEWCEGEALPMQALPPILPVVVLVPDGT
jgi:(1->4)-alpha-D-glucan 1-alpha-D-glucosylmutase